jgi:hypothetical protein
MNKQNKSGERYWRAHVAACRQSGMSRAEYCRQQNISYHALTYWQKKINRGRSGQAGERVNLVPVVTGGLPLLSSAGHDRVAGESTIRIMLPGRVTIEVGNSFSPIALAQALDVLEGR